MKYFVVYFNVSKEKCNCLSHVVATSDVDCDLSTAYC